MASANFVDKVTTIEAEWANEVDALVHDIFGAATSVAEAKAALSLTVGTDVQAYDATLQSLSALGTASDRLAYTTGVDTWAETVLTAVARQLLDDASIADMRTTLGLVIGTDVQAQDATLTSISALGTAADKIAYTTGIDTWAETALSSYMRTVLDDADAGAARTTLGAAGSGSNSDITALTGLTTALSVSQGGTGATSLTNNAILLGTGTAAITAMSVGNQGEVLTSQGGTFDPLWATNLSIDTIKMTRSVQSHASSISIATGQYQYYDVTLLGNAAFSFPNTIATGIGYTITVFITQGGTGSYVPTWAGGSGTVEWPGGTPPTWSTAIGATDMVKFTTVDGGTTWRAHDVELNFS